ncbi:MAG: hypothetical protein J6N77_01250 [Lachnospiraceae bacterium]|nr:hypothetical protein [Lachnospiraceae bacterium]
MSKWNNKWSFLAGGVLLGSYGVKILCSKDAKKIYTHIAAAVFRMKDEVMKDITTLKENAEDIQAAALDINEERALEEEAQMIEDAKAILADAEAAANEV